MRTTVALVAAVLGLVFFSACLPTREASAQARPPGGGTCSGGGADGCGTGDECTVASVTSTGAVSASTFSGTSFTASAGSGQSALTVSTLGANISFPGVGKFLGDGNTLYFDGHFGLSQGNFVMTGVGAFADLYSSVALRNSAGTMPLTVNDAHGFRITPGALTVTCGATDTGEGTMVIVPATGSNDTKICLCSASADSTPTYKWINIQDPTVTSGSTTTCPDIARF